MSVYSYRLCMRIHTLLNHVLRTILTTSSCVKVGLTIVTMKSYGKLRACVSIGTAYSTPKGCSLTGSQVFKTSRTETINGAILCEQSV